MSQCQQVVIIADDNTNMLYYEMYLLNIDLSQLMMVIVTVCEVL